VLLKREHIVAMFAKKAHKRFAARNWLKTVRALMQFAVADKSLKSDPTAGVKNLSGKTDGFRSWDDNDIAAFETRWPIGTRERLAIPHPQVKGGRLMRIRSGYIRNLTGPSTKQWAASE
jgi:hypothetical protein